MTSRGLAVLGLLALGACHHARLSHAQPFSCQSARHGEPVKGEPVISTLFHLVPPDESPAQLASAYCQLFAGPRGEAAVVGDQILVKDDREGHEKLDALIRAVENQGRDAGL